MPLRHQSSGLRNDATTMSSICSLTTVPTLSLPTIKVSTFSTPLRSTAMYSSLYCYYTKTFRSTFRIRNRILRSCGRHIRAIPLVWIFSSDGVRMSMLQMTRASRHCIGRLSRAPRLYPKAHRIRRGSVCEEQRWQDSSNNGRRDGHNEAVESRSSRCRI